ncbi:acyl-CoA dehydrogenase family protein [Streptomyces olivaceus]|uniref:acyl-CoA dehydrogenase family protein n=1 Tax=Streptomyces olivaceus TaxID=47716 RepID=UPI0008786036|nr:acyl-CoA dehydrogenase family protein [Streptomyces olivaceus]AOW88296.1 acyl-CoA dehydrogenase [Streptomyces olivaceus]MBZ6204941.1 acyl-CoA dehydrogenase family protein [Streptomyces olivaceus]
MTSKRNDSHAELFEDLRKLGAELREGITGRDRSAAFDHEGWKRYAELGVQGLLVPTAYGGRGYDPTRYADVMEELGFNCPDNGLLMALGAHILAVGLPIAEFGDEEQRTAYLPALASGRTIGAHAMTEPGTGSDALALTATARRDGDHYLLDGHKRYITNAPVADLFLVYATIDRSLGFTGVTAFLVERGDAGITVTPGSEKLGLRTASWGDVVLDGCRIPASRRLGAEKQGAAVFARTMAFERALILAPWLGVMRRELEECVRYCRRRRQFGKHIGHYQSVSNRLVDMRMRWELSRLIIRSAAAELDGSDAGVQPELSKLYTSEAAVEMFTSALQIYGALGYTHDNSAERNLRDALGMTLSSGASDMQRSVVAARMGLTWPDREN